MVGLFLGWVVVAGIIMAWARYRYGPQCWQWGVVALLGSIVWLWGAIWGVILLKLAL